MIPPVVLLAGVFGLVLGSFLNVVVYRVPVGKSVVSPPSACPRCDDSIRPVDNIPVVSWMILRGGCRGCGERISARYPLVEAGTGALFVLVALWSDDPWQMLAYCYLAAVAVVLALIDIDTHRLPNVIVLPSYLIGGSMLVAASWSTGDWAAMVRSCVAAGLLFAIYFGLIVVYPAGMGFGDVKLAGLLGMYLGWLGWGAFIVGSFSAFLLGGAFALVLVVFGRASRKSGIPFGPWMLLGAGVGAAFGEMIWRAYLSLVL